MNHPKVKKNDSEFSPDQYQQYLEEQLDWLTVDHDDLREKLHEQFSAPKYHPSMSIIDQWEQDMIESIHRMAVFVRKAIIYALDQHAYQVKKNMDMITPILRDARAGARPFTERDLQEWMALLRTWRKVLPLPVQIDRQNSMHELSIDLRQDPTESFESKQIQHYGLIRIIHPLSSLLNNTQEYELPHRTQTITPGGVIIIRE